MIDPLTACRLLAAMIVAITVLTGGLAHAERPIALVIGNSDYGARIGALDNPVNDAALISKTLSGMNFEVTELLDADQKT